MSRVLSVRVGEVSLRTPFPIFWTRHAHLPNITRDLMPPTTQDTVVLLPAMDAYEVESSLPALVTPQSNPPLILLSPRDYDRVANDTSIHLKDNKKKGKLHPLTVTTRHGHGLTTHEHYSEMANTIKAAFVEAPSEESLFAEPGKAKNPKLVRKFQERSFPLQDFFLSSYSTLPQHPFLFCSVQGGAILESISNAAKWASERFCDGYVLDAIPYASNKEERKEIINKYLPASKPRMVHRMGNPFEVLELVEQGIDIFASRFFFIRFIHIFSYTSDIALNGFALSFPLKKESEDAFKDQYDPIKINLYRLEIAPLVPGCNCPACQIHTRAYVHHLCSVHEMLSWILLSIHNLSYYSLFFDEIREQITKGTFNEYKQWFENRAKEKM